MLFGRVYRAGWRRLHLTTRNFSNQSDCTAVKRPPGQGRRQLRVAVADRVRAKCRRRRRRASDLREQRQRNRAGARTEIEDAAAGRRRQHTSRGRMAARRRPASRCPAAAPAFPAKGQPEPVEFAKAENAVHRLAGEPAGNGGLDGGDDVSRAIGGPGAAIARRGSVPVKCSTISRASSSASSASSPQALRASAAGSYRSSSIAGS